MVSVKEVPADKFIRELARYLKENVGQVRPPSWAYLVKTGSHKEKVPEDVNWWFVRAAALMRKMYVAGRPVGVERLRTAFGGLKDYGSAPSHFRKAGGSHIRKMLQQLERAGLVTKAGNKGRTLSPKGISLMNKVASKVFQEAVEEVPALRKYGGGSGG